MKIDSGNHTRARYLVLLLIAGLTAIGAIVLFIATEENGTMKETTIVTPTAAVIPPIDLAQPVKTEIATFGLG